MKSVLLFTEALPDFIEKLSLTQYIAEFANSAM